MKELEVVKPPGQVLIVVSRRLFQRLGDKMGQLDPSVARVVSMRKPEDWVCECPILWVRGFFRWWVVRRYARAAGASSVFLFEIDLLTLPFACQLGMNGASIGGILFRPSVHYSPNEDAAVGWRDWVRNARKDILYALTLRNPAVQTVFSLDPYFPELAARRYEFGRKVRTLLDPIVAEGGLSPEDPAAYDRELPSDRAIFLLFGALTRRKGILVLIEALARIEAEYAARIAVCIAGAIEPKIREEVRRALADLRARRPETWIDIEDRYLRHAELCGLLARCDVVLAPYQRFIGSSGILVWAARANKPILTSDYGLLGRFAREFRLGLAVDTTDPSELAAGMIAMVRNGPGNYGDPVGRAEFLRGRSPDRFARQILAAALGEDVVQARESAAICRNAATTD
jgi:glycosyltransferase involved in cell wall biosynthesis